MGIWCRWRAHGYCDYRPEHPSLGVRSPGPGGVVQGGTRPPLRSHLCTHLPAAHCPLRPLRLLRHRSRRCNDPAHPFCCRPKLLLRDYRSRRCLRPPSSPSVRCTAPGTAPADHPVRRSPDRLIRVCLHLRAEGIQEALVTLLQISYLQREVHNRACDLLIEIMRYHPGADAELRRLAAPGAVLAQIQRIRNDVAKAQHAQRARIALARFGARSLENAKSVFPKNSVLALVTVLVDGSEGSDREAAAEALRYMAAPDRRMAEMELQRKFPPGRGTDLRAARRRIQARMAVPSAGADLTLDECLMLNSVQFESSWFGIV